MQSLLLGRSRRLLIAPLLVLAFAQPVHAGLFGGCIDDVTDTIRPNQVPNNCTANDVTFTLVGLGVQEDGCVNSSDTVTIFLGAQVRNNTAQTRYDVGLYVSTDGDPNLDGARTGSCYREILTPIGGLGQTACPPLDLDGGVGPFVNTDGDTCGDLLDGSATDCDQNGDGIRDESLMVFTDAVTLPCRDLTNDGFIEIDTGSTWGQNIDDVGDPSCDGAFEVIPGTKAKCKLETLNSDVPMPDLGLSCSCNPTMVGPDETTTCSVTYTNSRTCTPDTMTDERFRCGTASYLRFEVDYDETHGAVSNEAVTRGAVSDDTSVLTWIPASSATMSPGIIGPNGETATLTFDYTVAPGTPQGTSIAIDTTTYWSNTSATDPAAVSQTALSCSLGFETTPVTLAWVRSRRDDDAVVVEWLTATESRNLGFRFYDAEDKGPGQRLAASLVPSRVGDSTQPQSYRTRLTGFTGERFYLEDVDVTGQTRLHGPFEVGTTEGTRPSARAIDWAPVRRSLRAAESVHRLPAKAKGGPGGSAPAAPIHLLVKDDGLYRVTYEELTAAGFDLGGVPAKDLSLTAGDRAIPLRIVGGPQLGPGTALEFLGEGLESLYTDTNVYRLDVGAGKGVTMAVDRTPVPGRETAPDWYLAETHGGEDKLYSFASPTDDPWYDTRMLVLRSPQSWSFEIPVDGLAENGPAARLTLRLWGVTDWPASPDHHLRARVNGSQVADVTFDGLVDFPLSIEVPRTLLQEGTNSLVLEMPADTEALADLISFEGYDLAYPRRFIAGADGLRFTAAGALLRVGGLPSTAFSVYRRTAEGPERIQQVRFEPDGGGYTASFAGATTEAEYWIEPEAGRPVAGIEAGRATAGLDDGPADLLILSHPLFLDALEPLAEARRAEGLAVKVVDVFDVYERWSAGVVDPEAIHDYVTSAAATMGTRYVLLVGADTYDYHDRLGYGSVSLLPTLYRATDDIVHFAPVDPLFGDVDGDLIPDVAVGRMPVRTVEELQELLAKTIEYEAKTYTHSVIAAADRLDPKARVSFVRDSEDFLAALPDGWTAERAYIDNLGVTGARQRLLAGIDAGAALTSFVGHSGPSVWTFSGLFSSSDAEGLTNSGRPTVVLQWGCWNTYYVEPEVDTLGHALLLGDHGAAAVLGASTLVESGSARELSQLLAPRIGQPGKRLGDALIEAKQALGADDPDRLDVLLGWTLLGDPTLVVEP
ncbi:MAG: hypothetical protein KDD11_16800 [Acidobacteria bacterium]|nr:hypothetical protein [Acidobacteriota bacterium]